MSSCLSGGGGRTYGLDLDIVKSPSSSTRTTSSSPSSTLSESTDSPIKISTRKPRTPRKRPNQTYNEAAALLSTVYPNIFSVKNLKKPFKHSKPCDSFSEESSELLPPFQTFGTAEFLIHPPIPEKPTSRIELKPVNSSENPCQSTELRSNSSSNPCEMVEDDFDAESILDEEMEESIGIDSIMGNLSVNVNTIDSFEQFNNGLFYSGHFNINNPNYYGRFGFGGKFEFGLGGVSAFRQVDNGDWWRFPAVNVLNISPKLNTKCSSEKKKKKKKNKKKKEEEVEVEMEREKEEEEEEHEEKLQNLGSVKEEKNSNLSSSLSLSLKLNYEDVLVAWSDRGSPFSDDILGTELSESDAIARLAQIDLFAENGGVREASVLRYREKRRSRLFSKKIRYQVRKVNADRRPRMKGRFVRRPTTIRDEEKYKK